MTSEPGIVGVILAGGSARRMGGGDKCLLPVGGRPILARIAGRLAPQCGRLLLNANGDARRFADFGLEVVPDTAPGSAGPLAGLLAAFDRVAAAYPQASDIVTVPGDTPFIPADLVARLREARAGGGARIACAASGGRTHPTAALWPVAIREPLRLAFAEGERRIGRFAAAQGLVEVEWPSPPDPFLNVNTPADLAAAEAVAANGE